MSPPKHLAGFHVACENKPLEGMLEPPVLSLRAEGASLLDDYTFSFPFSIFRQMTGSLRRVNFSVPKP